MKAVRIGRSVEGRPITALDFRGASADTILILGGFHGDEPKSVCIVRRLADLLSSDSTARSKANWVIVDVVNPDGLERRKRRNSRSVDINRNFPTANWAPGVACSRMYGGTLPASEPETRAVILAVERFDPARIISIHSISAGKQCNNYDGPGRELATGMKRLNGYPVRGSIGYETPGSFGSWVGSERGVPTVTLELPSLHSAKRCWAETRDSLLYAASMGRRCWRSTRPGLK